MRDLLFLLSGSVADPEADAYRPGPSIAQEMPGSALQSLYSRGSERKAPMKEAAAVNLKYVRRGVATLKIPRHQRLAT
jgi:hypothetical protein